MADRGSSDLTKCNIIHWKEEDVVVPGESCHKAQGCVSLLNLLRRTCLTDLLCAQQNTRSRMGSVSLNGLVLN